jgi:hypothetical protein
MKKNMIVVSLLLVIAFVAYLIVKKHGPVVVASTEASPTAVPPAATSSTAYDPTYGETKVKCVAKGWGKAYFTFSKKPGEDSLGDRAHLSLNTIDGTTKWTIPLTMSGRHGDNDETVLRYVSSADALTYADGRAPQQVTFLWYAARLPFMFGMKLDDKLVATGTCEVD